MTLHDNSYNNDWASLIETELNIDDKILKNINNQENKKTIIASAESLPINDILSLDFRTLETVKMIEYQNIIANNLKKFLKQCTNENIESHITKLKWLSNVNDYLNKKLNLPEITTKSSVNNSITRSSYKFCEYSYNCEYNYPKNAKKIRGCYKQHYVYNFLKADVDSIILHLIKAKENNTKINFEQLNICMNTICYVIGKMKEEIENLYSQHKEKYEAYHMERSVNNKKN